MECDKSEFPRISNATQYVQKAHNLFRDPAALIRVRRNGAHLCYEPSTNTFGSYTPNGVPKTMFRPGVSEKLPVKYLNPMDYFYGQ